MGAPDGSMKPVTQEDVARRAKVSRSVVSYVLNDGPRPVSAEARARVLAAIEALDYRPNKHAQRLIQEKWDSVASRQIGVVMASASTFERPYYGAILAGLHEGAHARGGHIRFIRMFDSLKNPAVLNLLVHRDEVSGIVLLPLDGVLRSEADRHLLERITTRVQEVVCVDWQLPGFPAVAFDRHRAGFDVTAHLASLGHGRIGYIGPHDERVRGFHAALAELGGTAVFTAHAADARTALEQLRVHMPAPRSRQTSLDRAPARTEAGAGAPPRQEAAADPPTAGASPTASALPTAGASPTALVAGTDEVAFGVLRYLRRHGLAVPEDVAVASIDGIDLSEFASPALTTMDVPKEELGRRAIELLVDGIRGSGQPDSLLTLLPTRLIVRDSSGAR